MDRCIHLPVGSDERSP